MQGDGSRLTADIVIIAVRACLRACCRRLARALCCVALCAAAGGCGSAGSSIGQALSPLSSFARATDRGVNVAFESIEGLPNDLEQTLARDLDEEATNEHIAIAPAGADAPYRVRSYLAAHAKGADTTFVWAWDVYDTDLHHAIRLTGEEHGKGKGWAAADEALVHRIARTGMQQLATFIASPPAAVPPSAPHGGAVVASDDARTQVAGR